jgi:hypothetical protein
MKKEDVFNFEDFLNRDNAQPIIENNNTKDELDEKVIENITQPAVEEPKKEEVVEDNKEYQQVKEDANDKYYKLYKDKGDEFTCDIMIEGSSVEDTYARIILESDDWSLIFPGVIKNGKCVVPIKKLGILKEGEIGKIKLEVVAEGNLFIPWEDEFKVKLSKKVTVNVNESRNIKPDDKVRVNIVK